MYAPALRPLRGVAKIVQFKKPAVSALLRFPCSFWPKSSNVTLLVTAERICPCGIKSCLKVDAYDSYCGSASIAAAVKRSALHACRWKDCCSGYAPFVKLRTSSLIERYASALLLLPHTCSSSTSCGINKSLSTEPYIPCVFDARGIRISQIILQPQCTIMCPRKPEALTGCLQALTRLCEQTECDVRSCLNTLQFLARKGRPIKVADLAGLSIGQKDINKGAFTIWQDLLQIKVCKPAPAFIMLHACHYTTALATLLAFLPSTTWFA